MRSGPEQNITSRQMALVRESWASVAPMADELAQTFYARLFSLDPGTRELFRSDMAEQRRKLVAMLGTAVDGLHDLGEVLPIFAALGRRHVAYGVREPHYPTVGSALVWALRERLGEAFTAEAEEAWTAVYSLLAQVMIEGAADGR